MKISSVILLISGLLLSPAGKSRAQENLRFESLTTENGLAHNEVRCLMQDRRGYLWFGTTAGLHKYDGYHFTTYKFDPRDSTSLANNTVYSLWEDQTGVIWMGTQEATCKFDPRTETFTRFERSPAHPFAIYHVDAFGEDQTGQLWAGNFEGELRQFDRRTGQFSAENYAAAFPTNRNEVIKQAIHLLYKDRSGTLWIGSATGLHRMNLTRQAAGKPRGSVLPTTSTIRPMPAA